MSPIKSTAFGYSSSSSDKVETDNNIAGIGATYTTSNVSEPGNGYRYLFFTSPGVLTVNRGGNVDVAVIAGGGSGGGGGYYPPATFEYSGGGGGAGGVYQDFNFPLPIGEYDITVGNGGGTTGSNPQSNPGINRMGNPGEPSSIIGPGISSITAVGGGAGGGSYEISPPGTGYPGWFGDDGGSGGGNGHTGNGYAPIGRPQATGVGAGNALIQRGPTVNPYTVNPIPVSTIYNPNAPTTVQGYPGGADPTSTTIGSGGGGAGGAGGSNGGNYVYGGHGVTLWTNDPGIPPSYGTAEPTVGPGRWFAGGGGGGSPSISAIQNGGAGGGGNGMDYNPPDPRRLQDDPTVSGVVNTGGGGGGGNSTVPGAAGGSGIVIIRYRIS